MTQQFDKRLSLSKWERQRRLAWTHRLAVLGGRRRPHVLSESAIAQAQQRIIGHLGPRHSLFGAIELARELRLPVDDVHESLKCLCVQGRIAAVGRQWRVL